MFDSDETKIIPNILDKPFLRYHIDYNLLDSKIISENNFNTCYWLLNTNISQEVLDVFAIQKFILCIIYLKHIRNIYCRIPIRKINSNIIIEKKDIKEFKNGIIFYDLYISIIIVDYITINLKLDGCKMTHQYDVDNVKNTQEINILFLLLKNKKVEGYIQIENDIYNILRKGYLYSLLPIEESGLKYHINAEFDTPVTREHITKSNKNHLILKESCKLFTFWFQHTLNDIITFLNNKIDENIKIDNYNLDTIKRGEGNVINLFDTITSLFNLIPNKKEIHNDYFIVLYHDTLNQLMNNKKYSND